MDLLPQHIHMLYDSFRVCLKCLILRHIKQINCYKIKQQPIQLFWIANTSGMRQQLYEEIPLWTVVTYRLDYM